MKYSNNITQNKDIKIPNLFIVGAPKCGTTSLHYWLSQHPEIFMSKPKEPRFFCTDQIKEADNFHNKKIDYFQYRQWEKYLNLFKNVGDEKIVGESTPRYLYSHEAPKKIYNFNQNAKIIILLREPFEFLRSYHSQILKNQENIKSFKRAMQIEAKRKNNQKKIPKSAVAPSFLYYQDLINFHRYIENYKNIFPNNQIKIILLDDLKNDPIDTYKNILKFLNIKNFNFIPSVEVKNKNKKIYSTFLKIFAKSSSYKKAKAPFQKIIPKKIRSKLFYTLKNKNIKTKERKPIKESMRVELMKEFKPEVENLSRILNRDLSTLWGYNKIKQ